MALYNVIINAARPSDGLHETELKVDPETSTNNHLVYLYPIGQAPCGSGQDQGDQLILNGGGLNGSATDWLNPGTSGANNGIAQYWYAYHSPSPPEYFTATVLDPANNGFTGRAQRFGNRSGTYLTHEFETPLQANRCYHFKMKYRYYGWVGGTGKFSVLFAGSDHSGSGYSVNNNTGNAIYWECWFSSSVPIYYIDFATNAASTCYLELDEVTVYDQT